MRAEGAAAGDGGDDAAAAVRGGGTGPGAARGAPAASSAAPARGRVALPPTTVFGLPLVKPPYGRVTAINMNTGEHVWMQPIGETPEAITNHERLKGVTIPKTGRGGRLGIMVTKTLLWAGERGPLVTVNGQQGSWFRSYDKATGAIVSETLLPANTTGVPMTYISEQQAVHRRRRRRGRKTCRIDRVDAAINRTGRENSPGPFSDPEQFFLVSSF